MNRFCKILLLWLLIASLPLQGVAAAVQLSCGSPIIEFTSGDARIAHTPEFSRFQVHMPGMHADTEHSHAASHYAQSDQASCSAMDDHCADQHHHMNGGCSNCVACCFGTIALPYTIPSSGAGSGSDIVTVSPPPLAGSHIPAGLERPPRSISA